MDYIKASPVGNDVVVEALRDFCLDDILGCGQCFRWEKLDAGHWQGIAYGRSLRVKQEPARLIFFDTEIGEFERVWYGYFDLCRDYGAVKDVLCTDAAMRRAVEFTPGMRVLRQEPWEALCSFILSQNNNIKRIRGLVARLCECFGDVVNGGYAFPSPEKLAWLSPEDLSPVRCGFRAGYLIDAAQKVSSGELVLEPLRDLPLDEASAQLRTIRGVGPKVAACALLYGLGRAESVPVDVWIDRALTEYYPNGIPPQIVDVAGLGQQYLFHYMRNRNVLVEK